LGLEGLRGRAPVGVAGPRAQRVALGVEVGAQVRAVHGRRRGLERARVVDGVVVRVHEIRVVEFDGAAGGIRGAVEAAPGIFDQGGHRFQVLLTNQEGDPVALEARHRARASVEDAIRAAKDSGLRNLPFRDFAANAVWLELVLIAQDLMSWAKTLLLTGELARAEPKRLRYRLLHVAARITRSGRRIRLHLPARWPWAADLLAAFSRLRALPGFG